MTWHFVLSVVGFDGADRSNDHGNNRLDNELPRSQHRDDINITTNKVPPVNHNVMNY